MRYLKVGDRVRSKHSGKIGRVIGIRYNWNYDYFDVEWDDGGIVGYLAEGGWDAVELINNEPLPLPG